MKLSKTSKENLRVADSFRIEPFEGGPRCLVSVAKNGNVAYLQGGDQDSIFFGTLVIAIKAIGKIRPDLVPEIGQSR